MVRFVLAMLAALGGLGSAHAGKVDYPQIGISLEFPDAWSASEEGDFLVLTSETEIGLAALTLNDAKDVTELKRVADEGINDAGVRLRRTGDFQKVGIEGLGAEFSGSFSGQPVKGFLAGIINPFGRGVTILALTSSDKYGPKQVTLVKTLADGLRFAEPQEAQMTLEWRRDLPGHKLTALSSSGSSGPDYYDADGMAYSSYTSYSSREVAHFCGDGSFSGSSSNSSSFDAVGGFGHFNNSGAGSGTWEVSTGENGETLLTLAFNDGDESTFKLTYKNGQTRLNGSRYYYTKSDLCD